MLVIVSQSNTGQIRHTLRLASGRLFLPWPKRSGLPPLRLPLSDRPLSIAQQTFDAVYAFGYTYRPGPSSPK